MTPLNGTQASLLGFLHDGPRTGWELLQDISSGLGRFWNVTQSHAYRELKTLEEKELIVAGELGPRDRRPFSLTAKGRKAFAHWIREEPGPEQLRFPFLVTLWFGEYLSKHQLTRFLDAQRRCHEERLAEYGKAKRSSRWTEQHPSRQAVLQFGIRYEEAILRWLEEIEGTTPPTGTPEDGNVRLSGGSERARRRAGTRARGGGPGSAPRNPKRSGEGHSRGG